MVVADTTMMFPAEVGGVEEEGTGGPGWIPPAQTQAAPAPPALGAPPSPDKNKTKHIVIGSGAVAYGVGLWGEWV